MGGEEERGRGLEVEEGGGHSDLFLEIYILAVSPSEVLPSMCLSFLI